MARNFISRFRRVVFTLFFIPSFLVASEIYILSYKTQVKNNQIIYQSLYASLAMTHIEKSISKTVTILLDKECSKAKFFSCYESEILDLLLKSEVRIQSVATTKSLVVQSFSQLQISPQYVQVEFNDTFVKMSLLN